MAHALGYVGITTTEGAPSLRSLQGWVSRRYGSWGTLYNNTAGKTAALQGGPPATSMIELGPATENDMVLEFLRAEVDSPRFGLAYSGLFDQLRAHMITKHSLLVVADLNSSRDNDLRAQILGAVRGYRRNCLLFDGFPDDVTWRRVELQSSDWVRVNYANEPTWVALSGGTRRVADGANNIDLISAGNANGHIRSLAAELRKGKRYPSLIGVENDKGEIVLAEGHCRATACALVEPTGASACLIGRSPGIRKWRYY